MTHHKMKRPSHPSKDENQKDGKTIRCEVQNKGKETKTFILFRHIVTTKTTTTIATNEKDDDDDDDKKK